MLKTASHLLSLLLVPQLLFAAGYGRQVNENAKRLRAEAAAERFIRRFRETRDFGRAFDEMAVSDAVRRLQKVGEIKSIGLGDALAEEIDERTAARLYKAFMNFVCLRSVHAASLKAGVVADPDKVPLPKEFRRVINSSKYLRHIHSGSVEDFPDVTSRSELRKLIADFEQMSALFRKHLPRNVFKSRAYRTNVRRLEWERGHEFEIYEGDGYYGIAENVEIYGVCRDIFCFRFIEEGGKLKVLGFSFGD